VFTLHFTPTYASWLNQVELWFAKIERDVIARGIFTSVKDLARKRQSVTDSLYIGQSLRPHEISSRPSGTGRWP